MPMQNNGLKANWRPRVKRSWIAPPGHRANLKSPTCEICHYNRPFCIHPYESKEMTNEKDKGNGNGLDN